MDHELNEIMDIAQEECAEVIQAISKVRRFGLKTEHNGVTNRAHLEEEIGDLLCMVELLVERDVLCEVALIEAAKRKRAKLAQWSRIEV